MSHQNEDYLSDLIQKGSQPECTEYLEKLSPSETAWMISRISEGDRSNLLQMLHPEEAADLLMNLPEEQVADILEETDTQLASTIIQRMDPQNQADILSEIGTKEADAIMESMPSHEGDLVRQLLKYPEDSAGGLMQTRFVSFKNTDTVQDVLTDLRENVEIYSDYDVQYVYVTSDKGALIGVLRLRDLVMTKPHKSIESIMIANPTHVSVHSPLSELQDFFVEHASFLGVPVTDDSEVLVGVVNHSDVKEAEGDAANEAFLKTSGIIGGEEFRSMPLTQRALRRLTWLCPNIVLNIIAASVIALFQDTIQVVIALAVFLPIISDMSGCSGNQAVAVSIRELTLGLIRPTEYFRVLIKEAGLGILNGIALGFMLGGVAYLWQGNLYLSLVVGSALALNTLLSVMLGGLVPLVMRRMSVDPALASGPLLTTVTDMCGFFLVLSMATYSLPYLT
jgi:magnesium transporter